LHKILIFDRKILRENFFRVDNDVATLFTPRKAGSLHELQALKQFSRVDAPPTLATSSDNQDLKSSSENNTSNTPDVFDRLKRTQYFWFDLQLTHREERNLLEPKTWKSVVQATRMIYENFTCSRKVGTVKNNFIKL